MIHLSAHKEQAKGWYLGPWNSDIPFPVGYANEGIDEKHYHLKMTEIYLVASGKSTAVVNDQAVTLQAGDILAVTPGEVHTFTDSSADYFHFVVHTPFVQGDKYLAD